MSLISQSLTKLPPNIPNDCHNLISEIKEDDTLYKLAQIRDNRELLKKLNEIEFIPWYLSRLFIEINTGMNLLIIFQDRLENLYKLTKDIPQILIDLWNGIVASPEEFKEQHVIKFAICCFVYHKNYERIDLFGQENKIINLMVNKSIEYGCVDVLHYLIETKNYNNFDNIFRQASEFKQLNIVKYLFEKRKYTGNNIELLWFPACNGNLKVLKYLIEEKKINNIYEAVKGASLGNKFEIIKYIAEEKLVSIQDILCNFCSQGELKDIKYLIEQEKDEDINFNLLLSRASYYVRLDLMKYFVEEKGANNFNDALLNVVNRYYAEFEAIGYLVEQGANNLNDALLGAVINNGRIKIVNYLVEKGANIKEILNHIRETNTVIKPDILQYLEVLILLNI